MSEALNDGEVRIQAIRPEEVVVAKQESIPAAVLGVFNDLIAMKLVDGRAVIKQDDIVARLVELGFDKLDIYNKSFLDVEGIYGDAGWEVVYEKPGYNETGSATFTFKSKN